MKKTTGITLVALVITIIILLILAGVAISLITGGEGLFAQANSAATKYNQAAKNEADLLNQLLNGNYTGSENKPVTPEKPKTDGSYDEKTKVNSPDTSELPTNTTKYVTWNEENGTYNEQLSSEVPENWYDYNNGQWANIKTTSTDESLEAYWVWIPRFAYKLPESSTPKEIEVAFVKNDSKTVVQADGTEVEGYYSTDTAITTDGSGIYSKATDLAKGINGNKQAWIIHPAFTFGDKQLNGMWFAKYEASSENPKIENGGGNTNSLKVQVKPGVTSWRNIQISNMFTVCRNIQTEGGALGTSISTTSETSNINTHMVKNIEWGAAAILSQSKYGIFNPISATGKNGNKTYLIWNNSNIDYLTGHSAKINEEENTGSTNEYSTEAGTKSSTTGTVYGIYDMAAGASDYVMGAISKQNNSTTPETGSTGFGTWPDSKYYDIYEYGTTSADSSAYARGKIGDAVAELLPSSGVSWNNDWAEYAREEFALMVRGDRCLIPEKAGIFSVRANNGTAGINNTFRPVWIVCN